MINAIKKNKFFTIKFKPYCRIQSHINNFPKFSTVENDLVKKRDVSSHSLAEKYDHKEVETNWYEWWEHQNFFKPCKTESNSFVILLPPPNITGNLHLGHALTVTIQDVIARWKRMKGESVIWVPGIDHAGIATQVAVEKHLKQTTGLTKNELGKEKFIEKIWEWKEKKGTTICQQLKQIGASLDWSNLKFTLDPVHSKIVSQKFIQLFEEGLIYRKESLINWSCSLNSSISDIEVDWVDITKKTKLNVPGYNKPVEFGSMYKIAYKIYDEDDEIVVGTTRPESMLGDVAIAVHPNDPVHKRHHNKMAWHPYRHEKIPVITDTFVNPQVGTGAVKITPSHSVTDFEIGTKHNLKRINVINENGCIENVGAENKFHGLKRFDARNLIIEDLKNLQLFRGVLNHAMKIPICSRSGDVIEYLLKKQWFLKCDLLAEKALNEVKSGRLKIEPENYVNVWFEWLKNITDWNLSRQLWWGHKIPLYNCRYNENNIWVGALNMEEAKTKAAKSFNTEQNNIEAVQDSDVLDTWFSSGLLPLNTLSSDVLTDKPPISLMVTGHDILFFWVARMVMLNLHLTGTLPFNTVLLHGLVCDSKGKKMSKSSGNIVQPEDIINGRSLGEMEEDLRSRVMQGVISKAEFSKVLNAQQKLFPKGIPECGVDALRLSFCCYNIQESFINFDINICYSNRNFCNKIWQAVRYFIKITSNYKLISNDESYTAFEKVKLEDLDLNFMDKWILSRLAETVEVVNNGIATNNFHGPTSTIKQFFTDELCSLYLESSKVFLKDNLLTQYIKIISILFHSLDVSLKLLSPFMPFVSEHLYQALPLLKGVEKFESISISPFPFPEKWSQFRDPKLEKSFREIIEFLYLLRKVKTTYSLIGNKPNVFVKCSEDFANLLFSDLNYVVSQLAKVDTISRVENHGENNVIKRFLTEECIAYIEHGYDKETLFNLLEPTLKKEENYRQKLQNLVDVTVKPEWKKKTPYEKLVLTRHINDLESELKKIEEFKLTLQNCSS